MTPLKPGTTPLVLPRSFRAIFALIMREMATSYGRSSAGYLWAILEPVGGIVILSLAFSVVMRSPALGESFPLFYATGMMPFTLYRAMQEKIGGALSQNKTLLFYPRVTYMDAIISRFLLTLVTQLLVATIVFSAIFLWDGVRQHVDLAAVLAALLLSAFLGLGVGTLNSVLFHLMPSWKQIWSIIYLFDTLPEWAQDILWFNPLVHLVGLARIGVYGTYQGDYVTPAYPALIAAATFLLGLLLLRRHAPDMINS
jgi:capsular polysaccharide transport system permease protein